MKQNIKPTTQDRGDKVMNIKKLFKVIILGCMILSAHPALCDGLFFEDEPVQDGLRVFEMSKTFSRNFKTNAVVISPKPFQSFAFGRG